MFGGFTNSLDLIFLGSAGLGGILFLVRMALSLLGGHDDVDGMDASLDHGGHGDFQLLSLHGLTSFFIVFGLLGLALHRGSGVSELWSIIGATIGGVAMMALMAKLAQTMQGLVSSGNIDNHRAIGQRGSVYLNIPAAGTGQVEVCIQGRLRVLDAVAADRRPIKTGERIEVVALEGSNTLVVRNISSQTAQAVDQTKEQ